MIAVYKMLISSCLTLLCSTSIAALAPPLSRLGLHSKRDHDLSTHDIYSWLAQQVLEQAILDEGEEHDSVKVPKGSDFTSIKVHDKDDGEIPLFMSEEQGHDENVTHAYIVIHGKLRDGHHYWKVMRDAIKDAKDDDFPGSAHNTTVIAPQFFSTVRNSGQYTKKQLAWGDLNAWQSGARATHPKGTKLTSFDALDAVVGRVANRVEYPDMRNITLIGHGGGAQLVQRYAAVGHSQPPHVHVRYIHGDSSSCAYFTSDRADQEKGIPSEEICENFNTWRYGFDKFPERGDDKGSVKEYFRRYITRDVVSLVGYEDTEDEGDQSCMARFQGSEKRRDRNLIWYRYIQTLAGTDEDLDGFPGNFSEVKDWSSISKGESNLRLAVIQNATHDLADILASKIGREALFSDGDISRGWKLRKGGLSAVEVD